MKMNGLQPHWGQQSAKSIPPQPLVHGLEISTSMSRLENSQTQESSHSMLAQSLTEVMKGQMQQLTDSSTCLKTAS